MVGVGQLVLILLIIFAIFGAGKIPRVMEDIGKGIRNLKKGLSDSNDNSDDYTSKKHKTNEMKEKLVTNIKKPKKY